MKIKEFIDKISPEEKPRYAPNMNGVLTEMLPDKAISLKKNISANFKEIEISDENFKQFKKCDEFAEVDSVEIYKRNFILDKNNQIIESIDIKLKDNIKFQGRVIIQAIYLGGVSYEKNKLQKPVLKNTYITPVLLNSDDFIPKREIVIQISDDDLRYGNSLNHLNQLEDCEDYKKMKNFKKKMHELLEEILEYPEAFFLKNERVIILKGFFEKIDGVSMMDLSGVETPEEREGYYTFFYPYSDPFNVGDELRIGITRYYVPSDCLEQLRNDFGINGPRQRNEFVQFMQRIGREDVIELNDSLEKTRAKKC